MAHYYPVVFPAGRSLAGDSLGFHAYSLRVDNCTNQWYLEESTVSYIPPYSLGMCLRLYGTGVAILLAQSPIGQPQLAPIVGEQVVGVYSDQLRTEVAASPIRQFTLVQAVSDLTEGPQPALPPVGVDRLYADTSGNIHHLHSNGQDLTLVDPSNAGTLLYPTFDPHYQALMSATALGGDLYGTVSNGHVAVQAGSTINFPSANAGSSGPTANTAVIQNYTPGSGYVNIGALTVTPGPFAAGNFNMNGSGSIAGPLTLNGNTTVTPPSLFGFGSLNERIRNPPFSPNNSISVESTDSNAFLVGAAASYVGWNVYYDGNNWQHFNPANASSALWVGFNGGFGVMSAPAGSNPLPSFPLCMSVDAAGDGIFNGNVRATNLGLLGVAPVANMAMELPNLGIIADNSNGATGNGTSLVNNGTMGIVTNFAGFIFLDETAVYGQVALVGTGAGQTSIIWQTAAGGIWAAGTGNAGKINVYFASQTIAIQNLTGNTITISAMCLKLRGAS